MKPKLKQSEKEIAMSRIKVVSLGYRYWYPEMQILRRGLSVYAQFYFGARQPCLPAILGEPREPLFDLGSGGAHALWAYYFSPFLSRGPNVRVDAVSRAGAPM